MQDNSVIFYSLCAAATLSFSVHGDKKLHMEILAAFTNFGLTTGVQKVYFSLKTLLLDYHEHTCGQRFIG
jgi:hypothetical protein